MRAGVFLLALMTGASAFAKTEAPAAPATPNALTLLRKAVAAPASLGPVTIETTVRQERPGAKAVEGKTTVQRNDSRHWLLWGKVGEDERRHYVNGREAVDYFPATKTYVRYDASSLVNQPEFGPMNALFLRTLKSGLADASVAGRLSGAAVTGLTFDGRVAYRLAWKSAPLSEPAPFQEMIVDRETGLLRQVSASGPSGFRLTSTYMPAKAPFPASTFVFTPPPGAHAAGEDTKEP